MKPEDAKHPGTRPADLKRYLKPLLKQRSDLVLIGRLLIIRPVRILSGAYSSTAPATSISLRLLVIVRLAGGARGPKVFAEARLISASAGYGIPISRPAVSCPGPGRIQQAARISGDLADVDRDLGIGIEWKIAGFGATVTALLLAGRRERAKELIDRFEAQPGNKERWQTWSRNQRALLERDAASLGAEFRAREKKSPRSIDLAMPGSRRPFPSRCRRRSARRDATNRRFRPSRGLRPRPDWSTRRRRSRVRSASPASCSGAGAAWSWPSR